MYHLPSSRRNLENENLVSSPDASLIAYSVRREYVETRFSFRNFAAVDAAISCTKILFLSILDGIRSFSLLNIIGTPWGYVPCDINFRYDKFNSWVGTHNLFCILTCTKLSKDLIVILMIYWNFFLYSSNHFNLERYEFIFYRNVFSNFFSQLVIIIIFSVFI